MARLFTLGDLITRSQQVCDMENVDDPDSDEWKFHLQSAYAELWSEVVDSGSQYFVQERKITSVAKGAATATMQCLVKSAFVDGETFELHDGYGKLTFEIASSVTPTVASRWICNITSDVSAADVATTIHGVINAATHPDGTAFGITSTDNGDGTLTLTNDSSGRIGNQLTSESVAWKTVPAGGFYVTDFTGGGETYLLPADCMTVLGVDYEVNSSTGERRRLRWLMPQHRNIGTGYTGTEAYAFSLERQHIRLHPPGTSGKVYYIVYCPGPPDLVNENSNYVVDVVTPDGENFLIAAASVKALAKEESDVRGMVAERERARERVRDWARKRMLLEARYQVVEDDFDTPLEQGGFWQRPA